LVERQSLSFEGLFDRLALRSQARNGEIGASDYPLSQWREANSSGEGGDDGELAGKEAAPCRSVPGFEIEIVNGIGLAAFGAV
jgi:hypothetical protein